MKTEEGKSSVTMRLLAVFHLSKVQDGLYAPDPDERVVELGIY